MLNEDIKIDLHIHSHASEYKEDERIVVDSTIDHLDVLVSKLEENGIGLCAITDHNRFDYELYAALRKKIEESDSILKHNLPGVEFDVTIDEGRPRCHIVTIFDDSDDAKLRSLEENIFAVGKLDNPEESYMLSDFERILKKIGLKTILIVHQKQSLDNHNGGTASLSGSTDDPYKIIQAGFIDALEYNSPRVEGIVKSSLRNVEKIRGTALFTGSDCHTWSCYPHHDASRNGGDMTFTKLRCLPTFKGLLMAVTSFETRANRRQNQNKRFIKSIKIDGEEYMLSRGINAIIGDNGSGKSMLLECMKNDEKLNPYYKSLLKSNNVEIKNNDENSNNIPMKIISQGSIIEKVKAGELFKDSSKNYYKDIDTKEDFAATIRKYFNDLCKYVENEIKRNNAILDLESEFLEISPHNHPFYYPQIDNSLEIDEIAGEERIKVLANILKTLNTELNNHTKFYVAMGKIDELRSAIDILSDVKVVLQHDVKLQEQNKNVKSIIIDKMNDLKYDLDKRRTSQEKDFTRINERYRDFVNKIVECVRAQLKEVPFPDFPGKMSGFSVNPIDGYIFTKTAKFHDEYLEKPFYEHCFNREYQDKNKLKEIKTTEMFSDALSNFSYNQIDEFKSKKIEGFIKDFQEEKSTISEASSNTKVGNTPGEIALVYYKFLTRHDKDYEILLIDQPEDDINPQRIKDFLNGFIDSIRYDKQIILVTHNPLLVVNLDVDNVICLSKNGDHISIRSGCLEYENDKYSVLKLVEDNLDGGYDAIERRIKAYGKDIN